MKRGDIVTVAISGDYGKPRPAVVIQSDQLAATDSVLVCLITSTQRAAPLYRLPLVPTEVNHLREPSDVMIDKIMAVPRMRIGSKIGTLDDTELLALGRGLAFAVGLADS